jgi:hypothetical protein
MERRYLVAALAIVATFAVFSRGLRTLERVSLSYGQHIEANAKAKCNADASAASRFIGKVRTHLRPGYPEEAQLLAEMDLPIAMVQAKVAEQIVRQNMAAAQCARATALRQAERAQREATRIREKMARSNGNAPAMPISWEVGTAARVDERIRAKTAALAERLAAQNVRLQMAANQMRVAVVQMSDSNVADANDADADQETDLNEAGSAVRCSATQFRQRSAQAIRARSRTRAHEVEQSGYR